MGQVFRKLKPGEDELLQKEQSDIKRLIEDILDKEFARLESTIKTMDDFYHVIYEIVEMLSERKGAMQFKLPSKENLEREVKAVLKKKGKGYPLDKEELKEIIENVFKIEYFQIGKGAKDVFLYIFGVPVVGLFAKRMIPGPTATIPDEIFIPAVTSATIVLLAKTNRL